jgi:integrase
MRKALTDKTVQAAKPPKKGRLELADTLEPGLALRITEDDRRSWAVRVWTGPADKRVQRRITVGHPRAIDGGPVLTLAQARQAARDVKQAAAEGRALVPGDGLRGAQTFGQLAEEYITAIDGSKRPRTFAEIVRVLRHADLADWRDRPAKSIGPNDVRALRDKVHERARVMATRYLRVISGLANWAVDEGKLPASPAQGVKPRASEKPRDRVLDDRELGAFWRACDALGFPHGAICKLLLLTAARLREVGHMEWAEVNFAARTWTIPSERSKNGKPHTVHLSNPSMSVLQDLAEQRTKIEALRVSPWVFMSAGGKFSIFGWMKERLDAAMAKELGVAPDFVLHDVRRTAATTLARLNVPPHIVEKILNHSKGEALGGPIARIYNRHTYAGECAAALEALGEFVMALAEPKVVPMRRA